MDGFVPDEEHYLDYHNLKGRIFLTVNKDAEALEHLVPWLHAIQKLRPDGTKENDQTDGTPWLCILYDCLCKGRFDS